MINQELKNKVFINSFMEGLTRGSRQLPFYLGLSALLIKQGHNYSEAISLVFLYVFSIPKFFTFFLEILGGAISHSLGNIGAFKVLPLGGVFRSVSLIIIASAFYLQDTYSLALASIAVIVDELGRCLMSGSFEDAYKRAIIEDHQSIKEIANIDVFKLKVLRFSQVGSMALGIIAIGFKYIYSIDYLIPFLFVSLFFISLYTIYINFTWLNLAKKYTSSSPKFNTSNLKEQLVFFLKSRALLFSLATGGAMYIFIKLVSLGPMISNDFLIQIQESRLTWRMIWFNIMIGAIIPVMTLLSIKFLVEKRGSNNLFKSLNYYKGAISYSSFLLFSLFTYYFFPLSLTSNVIFVAAFAFIFPPLNLWADWQRLNITSKAKENGLNLGENHSLYYSLIEGFKETTQGALSLAFILTSPSHINTNFFSSLALLLLLLFMVWSYLETKDQTKESTKSN